MISFVSTFPPAMCGIGTYTRYLTSFMPENKWSVIAFQPDEFSNRNGDFEIDGGQRIDYWISLENPTLPPQLKGDVLWLQHSFGMWGRVNTHFLKLIDDDPFPVRRNAMGHAGKGSGASQRGSAPLGFCHRVHARCVWCSH